jgi:hypothetical protein
MRRPSLLSLLLLLALLFGASIAANPSRAQPLDPVKHYFDLTVSLEWQPGTGDLGDDLKQAGCALAGDSSYVADLEAGLRKTAAYLYTYSAGQLALRNIAVYTGGEQWDSADLRVLASSSHRPSAFVGGIVDVPTQNISATSGMTGTVFYPATIFLGRMWDGEGSRCGPWSQPAGWRTIGHEWAHYALFLYDEYFNVHTNAEQYCTSTGIDLHSMLAAPGLGADSLMAYHYSANQLWLGGDPPSPGTTPLWSCKDTPQDYVHDEPDWKTIARFYPVTVPANLRTDIQFEGSAAAAAFAVALPAAPTIDTSAEVRVAALPTPRLVGQAYLIRSDSKGNPERIIGQGEIVPGEAAALPFWGVQAATKDRALIVVPDWANGQRYTFPSHYTSTATLNVAAPNLLSATKNDWRPNISVIPHVFDFGAYSEVTRLTVKLKDCSGKPQRPQVVYCPAGGNCSTPALMNGPATDGTFEYTFFFGVPGGPPGTPALHGYIYVRNPLNRAETALWYQIGGGVGPATGDGHAPLAEGWVDASPAPGAPAPPQGLDDSRLLYTPAQTCESTKAGLPSSILGIASVPVELQPVAATGNGGVPWSNAPRIELPPLRVRLSYSQDLLLRLGISEDQLVVLRLDKGKRTWVQVPTSARSRTLDWVAADARDFDGQGAVYALGYTPVRVNLPLLLR